MASVKRAIREGVPALVAPAIILGAIVFGFATASEAGVIACVYTLLIGLAYRVLTIQMLWHPLKESALL